MDEVKAAALIKEAAELIEPSEGEAVFYIRVGGEYSQLRTNARGIDPQTALTKAMAVLRDELSGAENCPYHASQPVPAPDLVERVARELCEPIMKEFDGWPLDKPVEWERVYQSDQEKLRTLARAIIPIIQAAEREECAKVAEATKCEYLFNAGEPEREMRSRIATAIRERNGG